MTDQELIQRVAVEVMGWTVSHVGHGHDVKADRYRLNEFPSDPRYSPPQWNPLTNLNHSFMVVEKMREDGWMFRLYIDKNNLTIVRFWKTVRGFAVPFEGKASNENSKIGHAICLAALKAKEAQYALGK